MMVLIESDYGDHPEGRHNPYSYPDDLFLLKAATTEKWGGIDLDGTIIERRLQQQLLSRAGRD